MLDIYDLESFTYEELTNLLRLLTEGQENKLATLIYLQERETDKEVHHITTRFEVNMMINISPSDRSFNSKQLIKLIKNDRQLKSYKNKVEEFIRDNELWYRTKEDITLIPKNYLNPSIDCLSFTIPKGKYLFNTRVYVREEEYLELPKDKLEPVIANFNPNKRGKVNYWDIEIDIFE